VALNVIFTTYLTKKLGFSQHDSSNNRKGGSKPDDFKLMKNWYESIIKILNKNTHAVIFHNECSPLFTKQYETPFLKFEKWEKQHRPSYNDERFYCFLEYLTTNLNIDNAFWVDMFDVVFYDNPFQIIKDDYQIYCGSEQRSKPGSFNWKWVNRKMQREGKLPPLGKEDTIYNAGCCGGHRSKVISLLKYMTTILDTKPKKFNLNMPIFNHSLRELKQTRGWKVFTGYPLHNVFESNVVKTGTFIKHK